MNYYWIYALFCGLLFFQGISLLVRKVSLNFKFLSILFFLIAYLLLTSYWNLNGLLQYIPHFYKTGTFFGYLAGPAFYFFLHFTFHRDAVLRPRQAVHLIPFLLHFIELLPFFLLSAEEKRMSFMATLDSSYMQIPWGYFTKGQHLVIKSTLIASYIFAGLYKNWSTLQKLGKSEIQQTRLFGFWLKWSSLLFLFSMCSVFVTYCFTWFPPKQADAIVNGTYFIGCVFCGLFFIFFPELSGWPFETAKQRTAMESLNDDIDDLLKEDISSGLFSALFTKILEEHHSDENLDIGQIARFMHLSERNLYRKIKEIHGISPGEVLNVFRLQKAHTAIQEFPFKSIDGIAKESGFRTKRNFSKRFKDQFGLLPSEFQKNCRAKTSEVQ